MVRALQQDVHEGWRLIRKAIPALLLALGLSWVPAAVAEDAEVLDLREVGSFWGAKGDRLHFQYLDKDKGNLEHVFYDSYQKVGGKIALPAAIISELQKAKPGMVVKNGPLMPSTVLSVLLCRSSGDVIAVAHFDVDGEHIQFRGAGSCGLFLGIYQELPNELVGVLSIDSKPLWTEFVKLVESNVPGAAESRKIVEERLKKYFGK